MTKNLFSRLNLDKTLLLLIFLSFVIFNISSYFHITKFKEVPSSSNEFPKLLSSPPEMNIWNKAYKFKNKDLKISNIQDYEYRHHFLPPKILGLAGKFFGIEFYENNKISFKGIYKFFLFQTIFFYLSVIFFYKKLKSINLNNKIIYVSICFLLFDPNINQYKYTIFGETIFFSILIFIFSFLIDLPKKKIPYIFLGILISICYLQRSVAMFLILVPIIALLLKFRSSSIPKIFNLLISFGIILIILGYLNFSRTNVFYVLPTQTVDNLYNYFLYKVEKKRHNFKSEIEAKEKLKKKKDEYAINNNLNLDKEVDRIKYYKWQRDAAIDILMQNKTITMIAALKSSLHSTLLNPTEILSKRIYGKNYYKSDLHQKTIKFRILYSLSVYIIIFFGFIYSVRKKLHFMHILLLVALPFFTISSWVGYTRYFVPTYLCLSLYFGSGVFYLNSFFKKTINNYLHV